LAGIGLGSGRQGEGGIGKYKDKYDESLNPFEAFKGRVSYFVYLFEGSSEWKGTKRALIFSFVRVRVWFSSFTGSSTSHPSSESHRTSRLCSLSRNHRESESQVDLRCTFNRLSLFRLPSHLCLLQNLHHFSLGIQIYAASLHVLVMISLWGSLAAGSTPLVSEPFRPTR